MSHSQRSLLAAGTFVLVPVLALLAPLAQRAAGQEITFDAPDVPIALPASQIGAPAYWLRKASNEALDEIKALHQKKDPAQLDAVDALLPLIVVGEIRVGDAEGARQALRLLESHAKGLTQPAMRAMAFLELADFNLQMCDQQAYTAAMAEAQKADAANQDPLVQPMLDLRMATVLDEAGEQLAADDVARQSSDMPQKASVYCALAIVANQRGNPFDTMRRLDRARAAAEGEDDDTSSLIFARVAKTYAQLNQFDAARISADNIVDPVLRADAYGTIALREMKSDDSRGYRDAMVKARIAIGGLPLKVATWRYDLLAYQQGEANDFDGIRQTLDMSRAAADRLSDPAAKAKAMFDLADVYGYEGNVTLCMMAVSDAEKAAARCTDNDAMLGAMSSARAHALAARASVSVIPGIRYCDLACTLARAGKLDDCQRLIDRIPANVDRTPAITTLAEARAKADDVDGAANLLSRLASEPTLAARVCRRIGESYSRRGQYEDLSRWLLSLESSTQRAYTCLGAADGMLDRRVTEFSVADLSQIINP